MSPAYRVQETETGSWVVMKLNGNMWEVISDNFSSKAFAEAWLINLRARNG